MSEVNELETVIEPVEPVEAPPVVVPPVEQSYIYQPTDETGRPLGGKQVIKYTNPDELAEKLRDQNVLLIRKLREETRKNRLGITDETEAPSEAQRIEDPVIFQKRNLTVDERVKLSRDLLDPERFEDAANTLFEATVGARPDALRNTISRLEEDNLKIKAKIEADAFVSSNPNYVRCQENLSAILTWMGRYNLAPVRENFQKAYDTLRQAGVMVENLQETTPPPVEPVVEPTPVVETVVEPPPPPRIPAAIPTGFTRNDASDTGTVRTAGDDIIYELPLPGGQKRVLRGLAAINAMPGDVYARYLRDPNFVRKVEQLEADQRKQRQ